MRALKLLLAALVAVIAIHCGWAMDPEDEISTSDSLEACLAQWSPTWSQASGANEWWVEYGIAGATVAAAHLEVVSNGAIVPLSLLGTKWVGPSSARIVTGTQVIVHAQTTTGNKAQTKPFGYLVVTAPVTDPCTGGVDAGTDGGGGAGACATAWSPTWSQASGSIEWWVEYTISGGTVQTASLEVVGIGSVALSLQWNKWVGGTGFRVPTGTQVIVHATSSLNATAQTVPFQYLVNLNPTTMPCTPTGSGTSSGTSSGTGSGTSSGTGGSGPTALIHYLGRFDFSNPMAPAAAWPGSAIAARFSGTGIDVDLHDDGQNFFAVSIDGATPTLLATTGAKDTYPLATGLAAGQHDLVLSRRTESFQGVVHFHGLSPQGGGTIVPSPAPFTRHIEFIGDSITCGYGNEGMGPACGFTAATENEWLAYGSIAARALSAEPHVIAYSGKGAYRNGAGVTANQMPVLYERTFADNPAVQWDFASWKADVVVINLGTNDFALGDPGQAYINAYGGLVKQVRAHYPNAYIVCAVGPMLSGAALSQDLGYVTGVVAAANAAGDAKVSFVDLGQQNGNVNGYGCDYHPSLKTHQLMAATLTAAIKAVAGW